MSKAPAGLRWTLIAVAVVGVHAALLEFLRPVRPRPVPSVAVVRLAEPARIEPALPVSAGEPEPVAVAAPTPSRLPPAKRTDFEARPMLVKTAFTATPVQAITTTSPAAEPIELDMRDGDQAPQRVAQATPAAPPAPAAQPPVPTYRTKPPAAATMSYRLTRGAIVGSGEITWRPEAGAYRLQLEGRVPVIGTLITQASRGRLDATGLVPERFTDKRFRRGEQAANFDRAAGRISFSGQQPEVPTSPGVQDRVSVMLQLSAIANAWTRVPPIGEHLRLRVIGARGDAHVWSMRFEGPQAIDTPQGSVKALRFLREPEEAHDTRAEFWLDPDRQFLPAKVVLTDDKGESLELLRTQ